MEKVDVITIIIYCYLKTQTDVEIQAWLLDHVIDRYVYFAIFIDICSHLFSHIGLFCLQ